MTVVDTIKCQRINTIKNYYLLNQNFYNLLLISIYSVAKIAQTQIICKEIIVVFDSMHELRRELLQIFNISFRYMF